MQIDNQQQAHQIKSEAQNQIHLCNKKIIASLFIQYLLIDKLNQNQQTSIAKQETQI